MPLLNRIKREIKEEVFRSGGTLSVEFQGSLEV